MKKPFVKRITIIFIALPLLCFQAFSQEGAEPELSGPKLFAPVNYVGATLGINTGTAADSSLFFAQTDFQYNISDWTFFAGIQGSGDGAGLTLSVQYWPFTWEHTRLGPEFIYNLDIYRDISVTNNILPGFAFECQPLSWFSFRIELFYLFKARIIHALDEFLPVNTFAYKQQLNFYLPHDFTLSQYVATYGTYRYTQPGDLELGLKLSWDMNENWQFAFDVTSRQIIYYLFTTAFTAGEFKLGARYIF